MKFAVTRRDRRFAAAIFWMYFVGGLLASIKAIPFVEASTVTSTQVVDYGQPCGA